MTQNITLLGATGSIGKATLDVLARHPQRYAVFALTAHTQVDALAQLCEHHRPQLAVMGSADAAHRLEKQLRTRRSITGLTTEVAYGPKALVDVASSSACDTVMAAIVGAAGLPPTLAAAKAGKKILLANKEALVMSGQLFMDAVVQHQACLLPIDSEHNAIFQCLPPSVQTQKQPPTQHALSTLGVEKIFLTASGGPFLHRDLASLTKVTPEEAVAHPKWVMGRKISVDSATMMNKGLEVIEAHWLFGATPDRIQVVIHPQSVVHSMVSYVDGSLMAQCGHPDMRTPIAHALAYPERIASGVASLDITTMGSLTFLTPDVQRFPCLALAYQALKMGASGATILNAANEVAVAAFLAGKCPFPDIHAVVQRTLDKHPVRLVSDLETLLEEDASARRVATSLLPTFVPN